MEQVEITCSGVDYRSKAHWTKIEKLQVDFESLNIKKQDAAKFNENRMEIQGMLDDVNKDLDAQKSSIKTIEHFIDKYIPIRVQ